MDIRLRALAVLVPLLAVTGQDDVLAFGPLRLEVHVSRTAHLFHVVDQLSAWSPFCHGQYARGLGPLDAEDQALLAEHRAVRARRDWGGGLEQTFYTSRELADALDHGVANGWLSADEAVVEERVFLRFAARVERLMEEESGRLEDFAARIEAERELLERQAEALARLLGAEPPTVPVFLLANPSDHEFGGGYNGGRLTLEIPRKDDALGTFVHEIFHAFLATRQDAIERAIAGVIDFQTMNEGLAHALAPGLVHPGSPSRDPLVERVREVARRGVGLEDYEGRVYRYALVLRPAVRAALADERTTLDDLLSRALDLWRGLAELEKAREPTPGR